MGGEKHYERGSHELGGVRTLHSDYLVVAGSVVERVRALAEVVHYVAAV